jgi:hypothetical protein
MNSITPAQAAPGFSSAGMIRSHMALTVAASDSVKKRWDDPQKNGGNCIKGAASKVAEDARRKSRRVIGLTEGTLSMGVRLVGESDGATLLAAGEPRQRRIH